MLLGSRNGNVARGFGRGSKELGTPTANFTSEVVDDLPHDLRTGIYYGWAQVDAGAVHKMVVSIGWNPFYGNQKKSMETYILHKFNGDFYGSWLRVAISGFIRPEENFASLGDLIKAIENDISTASKALDSKEMQRIKDEGTFFRGPVRNGTTGSSVAFKKPLYTS